MEIILEARHVFRTNLDTNCKTGLWALRTFIQESRIAEENQDPFYLLDYIDESLTQRGMSSDVRNAFELAKQVIETQAIAEGMVL